LGGRGNIQAVLRERLAVEERAGAGGSFSPVTLESYHAAENGWRLHALRRADVVVAAILFVSALLVRLPFIARGETLLHSDEAIVGVMAQDIAEGRRLPIYFYGQRYMGALEAYVIAAISPLFENPIHALRSGPAIFFAVLVALQFLMLTRWFGRTGGLIGAATLLAGPPMFMQWSISARGGYIEILVWGTALVWAYSEWFLSGRASPARTNKTPFSRQFMFGTLAGSGLWINPSIMFFIVPIVAHYVLGSSWRAKLTHTTAIPFEKVIRTLGLTALPCLTIVAILCLNVIWAVWVEDGRVQSNVLLGLVPKQITLACLAAGGSVAAWRWRLISRLQRTLVSNAGMLCGVLAGAAPAILYVVLAVTGIGKMDPSLPLGFRPLWKIGETMVYLLHGLPLHFGADPRPFEQLVCMGRESSVRALELDWSGIMRGANMFVAGSACTALIVFLVSQWRDISDLLRLRYRNYPPVVLLLLGVTGTLGLYLIGGCSHDFNTIRYILPLWVFLPGLLACVFIDRQWRFAGRSAVVALMGAWGVGQYVMAGQLGAPHPLRDVATALVDRNVDNATAELFDAHLLTYLTWERCRLVEFDPFWSRLDHLRPPHVAPKYLVSTARTDPVINWIESGFPGPVPPETCLSLWPKIRCFTLSNPAEKTSKTALPGGYALFELAYPIDPGRKTR
jgi:hypothetical protein